MKILVCISILFSISLFSFDLDSFLIKTHGYSSQKIISDFRDSNQKQATIHLIEKLKRHQPIRYEALENSDFIFKHLNCFPQNLECASEETLNKVFEFKNSIKKTPNYPWKRQKDFYNIQTKKQLKEFLTHLPKGFKARFRRAEIKYFQFSILTSFLNSEDSFRLKLALFFQNHFVSTLDVVLRPQYILDQFNLINDSLMGDFKSFVSKITLDPAMLIYLDGNKNFCIKDENQKCNPPNENYARELMELFTLGASEEDGSGNCYTEDDIKSASLALTGYTINRLGKVRYRRDKSDFNLITNKYPRKEIFQSPCHVKGFSQIPYKKNKVTNTKSLIDSLFERRGTQIARFISKKLLAEFLREDHPGFEKHLIRIQKRFYNSGFKLPVLYKQILITPDILDTSNISNQTRSPLELTLGLVKSFNSKVSNSGVINKINYFLYESEQSLFNQNDVKGWNTGDKWINMSSLTYRIALAKFIFDRVIKNKCKNNFATFKNNLKHYLKTMNLDGNLESCEDLDNIRDLIISNNKFQMR